MPDLDANLDGVPAFMADVSIGHRDGDDNQEPVIRQVMTNVNAHCALPDCASTMNGQRDAAIIFLMQYKTYAPAISANFREPRAW